MTGEKPQPQRCETCNKRETDGCPLSRVSNNIRRHGDYSRIVSVIRIIGCASHSSAGEPVPEQEPTHQFTLRELHERDNAMREAGANGELERLWVETRSDLYWVIGRIEQSIKVNQCMWLELDGATKRLNRVVESIRGGEQGCAQQARRDERHG